MSQEFDLINDDYLETNINRALKTYLIYLYNYDYITVEDYNELFKNTAIIIKKPTFFGQLWKKITKNDTDKLFIVVEQKTLIEPIDDSTDPEQNDKKCSVVKFPEPEEKNKKE